jgi:hypothetical protein
MSLRFVHRKPVLSGLVNEHIRAAAEIRIGVRPDCRS